MKHDEIGHLQPVDVDCRNEHGTDEAAHIDAVFLRCDRCNFQTIGPATQPDPIPATDLNACWAGSECPW